MSKTIITSGAVVLKDRKLLVNRDSKDDFFKLPGGSVNKGESFEAACIREALEENNVDVRIIRALSPMILWENPQTNEPMTIVLVHYLVKLLNESEMKPLEETVEIRWLPISEIRDGLHHVAPNIKFLLEKGDLFDE
jgi:8-oxo-dGTP diphosphatase